MLRRPATLPSLAMVVAWVLLTASAVARPGGGGSFSGGGGGGAGGGGAGGGGFGGGGTGGANPGGGGAFDTQGIITLCVGLSVVLLLAYFARTRKTSPPPSPVQRAPANHRRRLGQIRGDDPGFSIVLFEDFLYSLYAETRHAMGRGQIAMLSAYLAPDVLARMGGAPAEEVRGVVIGAMRYVDVSKVPHPTSEWRVVIELEVNVALSTGATERSAYVVERWTLGRSASARSRPHARARVLDCPGCGAPLSAVIAGTCTHCKRVVSTGELDWIVREAQIVRQETRPPLLTSDAAEAGTDLPTIIAPDAARALADLTRRDPSFTWPSFQDRVALVWGEFQIAWSARDLTKMRAYLSDNLFQMQSYWVEAYKAQALRNVSENARIEEIILARVESDASYDAITVRVRASGLDYTLSDADGTLVAGSRSSPRRYTEYWTLIRGSSRGGPARTERVCPSCGAPLDINMAGACTYCQAKVTTGEFDWVLSRIEQDEVYSA